MEAGTPAADVCRQLGVSEATFYVWKKKFAGLGVTKLRELRMLEEENARLKRVVADLTLDQRCCEKKFEAGGIRSGRIKISEFCSRAQKSAVR